MNNTKWLGAQACARLHNYCVNERLRLNGNAEEASVAEEMEQSNGPRNLPSQPHDEDGNPIDLAALSNCSRGYSELREKMVERVEKMQLRRPTQSKRKRITD